VFAGAPGQGGPIGGGGPPAGTIARAVIRSSEQAPVYPLKCQVFVREDLERRVTTWAITAFISENPSMRAHCLTH
jgi:hypothetical protein